MLRIAKRTLGGKLLPRFNLRPVRPPGVRFPRAFHFAKRVACARGTHYRQRPRVGQELEGNKRRGNDRRIYDRCQTNAELLLLFPFSPPPPSYGFRFAVLLVGAGSIAFGILLLSTFLRFVSFVCLRCLA